MELTPNEIHILETIREAESHDIVTITKFPEGDGRQYRIEITHRDVLMREQDAPVDR